MQQEWAQQRLEAEQEAKEYNNLCSQKDGLVAEMNACLAEQDRLYKYMASVEDEYQRAKEGAQQAMNLNKQIQDVDGKIRAITNEAADYAESLKAFIENIEINVFLPKLASNLSQEINNILRIKEQLLKQSTGTYPIETLRDVTARIIDYLKELSLCSQDVDEENVVAHMIALQNATNAQDSYDYLDDAEVEALKELPKKGSGNQFVTLDRKRQDMEIRLANLDNLRTEKRTLEQTQAGGDNLLIANYEDAKRTVDKLKSQEDSLRSEIQRLEKRIHQYDVQIQQEPDLKFDTLVKLRPFFDKVADSLLKKKKAQIETEMQSQLNKLLVSYKGHVARVELSDSMENFNIKLYHSAP